MGIQERVFIFVTRSNWILLGLTSLAALAAASPGFAKGVFCGGMIVTINFHLLSRTLKKALTPPHLSSYNAILAKYYIRFLISGIIIFILIAGHYVNFIGLFIGLSIVVASIFLATACEIKKLIFKEAV